jgi:hypothetical protein
MSLAWPELPTSNEKNKVLVTKFLGNFLESYLKKTWLLGYFASKVLRNSPPHVHQLVTCWPPERTIMQSSRNRLGKTRKAFAAGIAAALLISGVGASAAHADEATVIAAIAEVKDSVTTVNGNVKALAAQVQLLQAAVGILSDTVNDQIAEILATQATLIATLAKIQAQITALQKASAKKK